MCGELAAPRVGAQTKLRVGAVLVEGESSPGYAKHSIRDRILPSEQNVFKKLF